MANASIFYPYNHFGCYLKGEKDFPEVMIFENMTKITITRRTSPVGYSTEGGES